MFCLFFDSFMNFFYINEQGISYSWFLWVLLVPLGWAAQAERIDASFADWEQPVPPWGAAITTT